MSAMPSEVLRVICPFVVPEPAKRGLHPFCEAALARYAPEAEMVDLGSRHDAYYALLREVWADGKAFLLVEHDIELHEAVIPELGACQEPWCLYAYNIGWPPAPVRSALGCVRFSARLLAEFPDAIAGLPVRGWQQLDCSLYPRLREAGFRPHEHEPLVAHHHRYAAPGGERCACGEEDCGARAEGFAA